MSEWKAWIQEADCIGCTKCLQVCPVDAIFGASHYLHTVIQSECISCKLCVPACPVDCITLIDTGKVLTKEERLARAEQTKYRVGNRQKRLAREAEEKAAQLHSLTAHKKRFTEIYSKPKVT